MNILTWTIAVTHAHIYLIIYMHITGGAGGVLGGAGGALGGPGGGVAGAVGGAGGTIRGAGNAEEEQEE